CDTDMANRGMLPKFRPAALGEREASLRPMIRPVRASAPPPAPNPPRRFSSGIRHPELPAIEGHQDIFTPAFSEPPTMAARERIHAIARELPREERFEDETQARPGEDGYMASRWSPHARELESVRADMDVPYESLPSLEVGSGYYDPRYEPDPSTQM